MVMVTTRYPGMILLLAALDGRQRRVLSMLTQRVRRCAFSVSGLQQRRTRGLPLPHRLVGVGDPPFRVGDVVLNKREVFADFPEGFAFAELGESEGGSGR